MPPRQRIALCRMIEKINTQESYAQKLGVEDRSHYRAQPGIPEAKLSKPQFAPK